MFITRLRSRCTSCGFDFERNYHVRQDFLHVHDHKVLLCSCPPLLRHDHNREFACMKVGTCERCGSATPKHYTGSPGGEKMKKSR